MLKSVGNSLPSCVGVALIPAVSGGVTEKKAHDYA